MHLERAPIRVRSFWSAFDPDWSLAPRFYEAFRVGFEDGHADTGACLVLDGSKTATSSLLWEYEESGRKPPGPGALSVLLDGHHQPVCIVETTRAEILGFEEIQQPFCAAYGECDGTLEGWRNLNWPIFQAQCHALGREPAPSMPVVCETFQVVYPRSTAERLRVIQRLQAGP